MRRVGEPKQKAMKMAELARVSGTSRSTIHLYRNMSLLPPPERRGPKLHLYGPVHLQRLRDIAHLRREGRTLIEIQHRFAHGAGDVDGAPARRAGEVEHAPARKPRRRGETSAATPLREVILDAAAREFVERGYDAVHVDDIARAAGIGKARFYEHFTSKADLFVECLDRLRHVVFSSEQRSGLGAGLSFEDEGRLRAAAVLYRFAPYRMMTNLLAQAAYGPDQNLARRARAALHRMVTDAEPMFKRAIAAKALRNVDSELLSYMTWGALIAVGDRLALDDRYTQSDALEAYLDFATHGSAR